MRWTCEEVSSLGAVSEVGPTIFRSFAVEGGVEVEDAPRLPSKQPAMPLSLLRREDLCLNPNFEGIRGFD